MENEELEPAWQKALEEAYLNYGESRPIVRFGMFLFGYSE